jgi:hypothetical protein
MLWQTKGEVMRKQVLTVLMNALFGVLLWSLPLSCEASVHFGAYLNGNWVEGTTQTVYAGQQINLSEHYQKHNIPIVPGQPSNTTITYAWEIDGHPIKSYVIGNDSAEETDLTPADLGQPTLTCYFTGSGPATAICRVTETAPDGETWHDTGSCGLNIYKPRLTPVPTLGQFHYTNTGTQATLEIGDASGNPYGDGIHITSTGTVPPGMPLGNYDWLQLLHDFTSDVNHIPWAQNAVDPTLDGAFPYNPAVSYFEDSPRQIAVTAFGLDPEIGLTINATAYLMWNCGLSGAIWVPVYYVDWNASGTESGGQITSSTGPSITNTDTDPVNPPTWNNTRT